MLRLSSEDQKNLAGVAEPRYVIRSPVLCVDFDETFTLVDSLHECVVAVLRARPWTFLLLPFWLLSGREALKRRLAELAGEGLRSDLFPRRPETLALIEAAKHQGCRVELVSAAHQTLLDQACRDVGFDAIFGTRAGVNLKGRHKAKFLAERHPDGFAYVGDSRADIAVWRMASECFAVGISSETRRRIESAGLRVEEIAPGGSAAKALLRAMRPGRWVKNLLVFALPALAIESLAPSLLIKLVAIFVAFCLVAGGTYLINDLTDIAQDRLHPEKRRRPLASGRLSIALAVPTAALLTAAGLTLAVGIQLNAGLTLLAYFVLAFAYSLGLKRVAFMRFLILAILIATRIAAGGFIAGTF